MKLNKYISYIFIVVFALTACKKRGCTDYEALNYDPEAKQDDNSCYYFWVGQNYQGGKIFYIDRSRKHGLIAAGFDLANSYWGCSGDSIEIADINDTRVGIGSRNSQIIVDSCGFNTAAGKCLLLDTLGFDDWYLPSLEEMRGVSEVFGRIGQGNLTPHYYWTSSQINKNNAYLILNANRSSASLNKGVGYSVRPIRSF